MKLSNYCGIVISLLCAVICVGSMYVGTTFAYFSESDSTSNNSIQSANFSLSHTLKDENGDIVSNEGGKYSLDTGKYTVVIRAEGNASRGFCILSLSDGEQKTDVLGQALNKGVEVSIELEIKKASILKIEGFWGTALPEAEPLLGNAYVFPSDN